MGLTKPAAVLVIILGFLGALFWGVPTLFFAVTPQSHGPVTENREPTLIEVSRGQSPHAVSAKLLQMGVIGDGVKFYWLGKLTHTWGKLKAGEYAVSAHMTPLQILATLKSGLSYSRPFTIREGENIFEIAEALETKIPGSKKKFLALVKNAEFMKGVGLTDPLPISLEGYLYPETYGYNKRTSVEELATQMTRRFFINWSAEFDSRAKALGLSRHEVVTLASIIEKETGADEERPLISSVFHNRLKKHMRLQSDPTIIYGIWNHYDGNLHKSDLLKPTAYNTYTIPTLPPGPIGNPGKEALQAALFPAQSEFLYFVSHNNGTHEFTSNLKDHEAAVRKFQIDPSAREGKSWRDLAKRKAATN